MLVLLCFPQAAGVFIWLGTTKPTRRPQYTYLALLFAVTGAHRDQALASGDKVILVNGLIFWIASDHVAEFLQALIVLCVIAGWRLLLVVKTASNG